MKRIKSFLFSYQSLGLVALTCLLVSLVTKWFNAPLGHSLYSYHLSFFPNKLFLKPQFFFTSIGAVLVMLLLLGSFAVFKKKSWLKLLTGWLVIFLGLLVISKMVFYNFSIVEDLHNQNIQVIRMLSFSAKALPLNRGIDPTFDSDLSTDNVTDRLYLVWHFLTFGWFFFMFSGIIFIILGFKTYTPKRWGPLLLILFFPLLFLLLLINIRPILAENYKDEGDAFLSYQKYQKAFHSYEMAMKYNKEHLRNYTFALNYGEACYNLKLTNNPYCLLFWASKLDQLKKYSEAIETLTKAYELSAKGSLFKLVLSNTLTKVGTDYFLQGLSGSAIANWEKSIQIAPEHIENWYYLSFAYKLPAFYKKTILAGEQFTLSSNNNFLNANSYANMGDACYWLKDFLLARIYYAKSQTSLDTSNYRAVRDLGGT